MKLHLHRQDALVHFHVSTDDGTWFAVACARGVMRALGRKMEKDEKTTVDIDIIESECSTCGRSDSGRMYCSNVFHLTKKQKIQGLLASYKVQASGGFAEALEDL